jgi:hypothetical protein
MLLRGTRRARLLQTGASKSGPRPRYDTRIGGASRPYGGAAPSGTGSRPEDWLGLGLPLVWWGVGVYGASTLAVSDALSPSFFVVLISLLPRDCLDDKRYYACCRR